MLMYQWNTGIEQYLLMKNKHNIFGPRELWAECQDVIRHGFVRWFYTFGSVKIY